MASVLNTPALSANSAVSPRTLGVTVNASATKCVFCVALNDSVSITAATLDGVGYSRLTRQADFSGAIAFEVLEFDSPATGSVDLVITFDSVPNNYIIQYDLGDAATGTPEDTVSAPVATKEAALTTTVGAICLLFAYDTDTTANTPSGGLTEDVDALTPDLGGRIASGHLIADTTSETPSFGAAGGDAGVIALSIADASSPPSSALFRPYFL